MESIFELVLKGEIMTPIITRKTYFFVEGCKAIITKPRRRYYNKINAGKRMYPYSFECYLGSIELRYKTTTKGKAKKKLDELLKIKSIGRFASEGLGIIQWIGGDLTSPPLSTFQKYLKLKIRKGLPSYLPKNVLKLIRFGLLHDFVNCDKHRSKIYVEPNLKELEELRKHHNKTQDEFIRKFQYYDQISAIITRKIRSPKTNRYNWSSNSNINFEKLSKEIEEVTKKGVWKLYEYIYNSEELEQLNESLEFGHTSLRNHLLIIVNLIVQDFIKDKL
ncbi:MAG: hypothetical protein ACFFCZ_18640 [Promethearchaeota archaeon]